MKSILSKKWIRVIGFIILMIIAVQFIRPGIDNPPITADVGASDSVKMVLRGSCYNCHSNEVSLAWFDRVAPVNWIVARDIREGRKVVNFSEWDKVAPDRQKGILFEALNQMQFRTMPLKDYTLVHPNAKVGNTEIDIFRRYLSGMMVVQVPDSSKTNAWNLQYKQWIAGKKDSKSVKPSLNGFRFDPGYKDWVVINSTNRLDNGTLKMILGNDIAVKAIKSNKINPWPDGSSFAKLTWVQTIDSSNNICAGEFKQIAFMLKDAVKYRSTDGWGFSQWDKGLEMSTHGKSALFTTDCVNCHKPMKAFDYVFTLPLNLSLAPELEDKLISSSVDVKAHTMSTLYGNDIAAKFARSPMGDKFPEGSKLTLVTWRQKEDIHWFGANIPDTMIWIEKISFSGVNNTNPIPNYERFAGNSQTKEVNISNEDVQERIKYITNQRAAVLP